MQTAVDDRQSVLDTLWYSQPVQVAKKWRYGCGPKINPEPSYQKHRIKLVNKATLFFLTERTAYRAKCDYVKHSVVVWEITSTNSQGLELTSAADPEILKERRGRLQCLRWSYVFISLVYNSRCSEKIRIGSRWRIKGGC